MLPRLRNPAVVVNCETAGVGIIHSLSLEGIDIITVERDWPPTFGRFSRYPKLKLTYRPWRGETLVDALLRAQDLFEGKGILFPSTDRDLEALILGFDRLAARYCVPASPHIGMRIFEKNWQYELAERTGTPLPRHTRFLAGQQPDLYGFRFPLIIKPSSRAATEGEETFRLRILDSPEALARCLEQIAREFPGRAFQIAENIPGEPDQLYTVGSYSNREGKVLRSYTGRKVTQYPYHHGMASVAESVELPKHVVESARALLEEAKFHGISQVEFKFDKRDGQYKLLEINGRSWLWVKLAAFSGVNLPLIQYYDLTDDPRVARAVAEPQRNDRFFVFDYHVKRNKLPSERQRIQQLRRCKTLIPAMDEPTDRWLRLAHRVVSTAKLLRR